MGMILQFTPRHTEQAVDPDATGPAEIIIFPGVRIERLDDDAPAQAPSLQMTAHAIEERARKVLKD